MISMYKKSSLRDYLIIGLTLVFWGSLCNLAFGVDPLIPVETSAIKVNGFWSTQYNRLTEKWLPHCIKEMEEGGRGRELLNLVNTAKALKGESHGKFTGLPWSDAYVYNTVESICMALAIDPQDDETLKKAQALLRTKLEEWIPIILAAQMDSGYIHSYHTLNELEHFSNIDAHEFYVMGYFLEMGVAHYRMTNGQDRRLYDASKKLADHLCATFGPEPKRTWKNGHPGLEYALCRLGRLVNEVDGPGKGNGYIDLAKHFLDHQHEIKPNPYNQSERPAIEMEHATGHAVRATYFYTAMADMALLKNDQNYLRAVDRLWSNAIHRKHYLTGGVGASHNGEAFADDFDLRNDGYCESCASCGMSFWADRMHRIHHSGHYQDVIERVLYNNVLGALELSGENFFYQNPLASDRSRYPWHACPCCVGNIPRALLTIKDIMYATNAQKNTLYLNQFMDSEMTIGDIGGTSLLIRQETDYPWQGTVKINLTPARRATFTLKLRVPDRTESQLYTATPDLSGEFELKVNGKRQRLTVEYGYVSVRRAWRKGDKVELTLPMPVQRIHSDERVIADFGRVAIIRGPLVYSFEQVDHQADVRKLVIEPDTPLTAQWQPELLEGVMTVTGTATIREDGKAQTVPLMGVPNYARLNRGGYSQIWMLEDPDKAIDPALLAEQSRKITPIPRPDLEPRQIDRVIVADYQSEKAHKLKGEKTDAGEFSNRGWRHAGGGWFSYQLKVDPHTDNVLLCSFWGSDVGNRVFDIVVADRVLGQLKLDRNKPNEFFDVSYPIPSELIQGKETVEVRFVAASPNATAGGVFDIWILREKE